MCMENDEHRQASENSVEHLKGCPICENSDPQLEHELHAFAQLLFDIWLARQDGEESRNQDAGI
jgi:hypothetical protein